MEKMRLLIVSAALCFSLTLACAQSYRQLSGGSQIAGEQAYILPKASFVVEIPVTTTILSRKANYISFSPQQFKVLQRKYGLDPAKYKLLEDKETFSTNTVGEDAIKLKMIAVPDYEKVFYIVSGSGWNKNQSVSFTYGTDGILTDGEASLENKTFDIVVKGMSGVVNIIGNLIKGSGNAISISEVEDKDNLNFEELDKALQDFNKLQNVNNYDIYKDMKADYEKRYAAAFAEIFYSEKKNISTIKIIYTPKKETRQNIDIPFFDTDDQGKISFDAALQGELWGKEIYFSNLTKNNTYHLKFKPAAEQQSACFRNRSSLEEGFAFNIPQKVELQLSDPADKIAYTEIFKVPQFGIIGYVNNIKRAKLIYSLDPLTGELKKLSIGGKAILVDQVGNAASAITNATSTFKGESSDSQLDKEVNRLENEKKKRDLLKELGLDQ